MSISTQAALAVEVERLRSTLKIIRTWAVMHDKDATRDSLVPSRVIALCDRALAVEESK